MRRAYLDVVQQLEAVAHHLVVPHVRQVVLVGEEEDLERLDDQQEVVGDDRHLVAVHQLVEDEEDLLLRATTLYLILRETFSK